MKVVATETHERHTPIALRFPGNPGSHVQKGIVGHKDPRAAGFTVFELVIILVLVGLLSVIALPVFLNEELRVTPAADQIAGELRYAQSLAMTHGDSYSFNVSGDTYSISKGSGGSVALSNGDSSGSFDGLSLSIDGGGSGSVTFSSLFGDPGGAHSVTVSHGGNSATISIAAESGYVLVSS